MGRRIHCRSWIFVDWGEGGRVVVLVVVVLLFSKEEGNGDVVRDIFVGGLVLLVGWMW